MRKVLIITYYWTPAGGPGRLLGGPGRRPRRRRPRARGAPAQDLLDAGPGRGRRHAVGPSAREGGRPAAGPGAARRRRGAGRARGR